MPRQKVKVLYQKLHESRFDFVPSGEHHIDDIYRLVKQTYPDLCDDFYLCSQNCREGHNRPEWQHRTRAALWDLKKRFSQIDSGSTRGSWQFRKRISLPETITHQHLVRAAKAIDDGIEHAFAESTKYDAIIAGKRYPPKAIVGLAANYAEGLILGPEHFTAGIGSKCFRIIEGHGIEIARKPDTKRSDDLQGLPESLTSGQEGNLKRRYVSTYERNPRLRDAAIQIHGLDCMACGFNFERTYGQHGAGFIHVHHVKALSEGDGERIVDAEKDLTVLCPNCHSMVHRLRSNTLTVEQVVQLIRSNQTDEV